MVKKIEVGIDALAAIALIVVVALSFIGYQRYQYLELMQDAINCEWNESELAFEVGRLKALLKKHAPDVHIPGEDDSK